MNCKELYNTIHSGINCNCLKSISLPKEICACSEKICAILQSISFKTIGAAATFTAFFLPTSYFLTAFSVMACLAVITLLKICSSWATDTKKIDDIKEEEKNLNLYNITYFNKDAPIEELHFTWADMDKLSKSPYGLRHVSSKAALVKEANEGVYNGCSLNITANMHHQALEEKIDFFINSSLIFDAFNKSEDNAVELKALIKPGETKIKDVANLVNVFCLSILKYSEGSKPCDFSSWGKGLGRYSKRSISSDNVIPLPCVTIANLGYTAEQLEEVISQKEQSEAIYARMVACYRTLLLHTIRKTL